MSDEPVPPDSHTVPDFEAAVAPVEVEYVVPDDRLESVALATGEGPPLELADPPRIVATVPDSHEPLLDVLNALGRDLGRRIDDLAARLDRETRAEETREKVVDRLHAELQEYKNDLLLRVMKPVFIDLIQLHDDLGKRAEASGDDRLASVLADYQQGIEDILYRQGVEPFQSQADDQPFDARRQRAVATVPTDEPDQNKKVAGRVRRGFAAGDKLIRPELVTVYSLRKT